MLDKTDKICIIITLVVIELICIWCVDVSVSAMVNQGIVTNGIYSLNPILSYHIGLYGAIVVFLVLVFILVGRTLEAAD